MTQRHALALWLPLLLLVLFNGPRCVGAQSGSLAKAPRWSADRRLTFAPGASRLSYNFARSLAAGPAGDLHVTWFDTRGGSSQVYYKRSPDGGATWEPDRRLSRGTVGSEHPAIALSGRNVYVVWHDLRNARPEIFLRRSADGGATWKPEIRLSGDGAHPSVAVSGSRVRVVWGSLRDGQTEVYTRGSMDFAATWSAEERISELPYESWVATVELSRQKVFIGFVDYGDANEEELLRFSQDGGATWAPPTRLTNDPADSWAPSIAISGSTVHFAWFDRRDSAVTDADVESPLDEALVLVGLPAAPPPPRDPAVYYLPPLLARLQQKMQAIQAAAPDWVRRGGDPLRLEALLRQFEERHETWTFSWEIYYRRSLDGGLTWGPGIRLTEAPGLSMRPSLAVSGRDVHMVWFDGRDGQNQIYAKHSPDGGETWGPDERLTNAPGNPLGDSMHPCVAAAGNTIYVVWYDQRDGNAEIYFKKRRR